LSLCLGRISALSGQKVLLIDCDLRRQSINAVLDVKPELGLLQVLMGERDWKSVLVGDVDTGLHILPVAQQDFTPRDVFGSEAMSRMLGELRSVYDLIILDCPPILAVAETRVLARIADTVAVVVRWDKTPARAVRTALRQVDSARGKLLGVVLNCVDPKGPGRSSYQDSLYYGAVKSGYYAS